MTSFTYLPFVLAALLATAAGCGQVSKGSPAGEPAPAEQPAVTVAVVKPERTTLQRTVRQP